MSDVIRNAEIEDAAAATLRAAGWIVIAPATAAYEAALRDSGLTVTTVAAATDAIPEPEVGQVWVSPRHLVNVRTIVAVGPTKGVWSHLSADYIVFRRARYPDTATSPSEWRAWAKRTGARPQ